MQTYYMLGKYLPVGLESISTDRTDKCRHLIEELGGEIILMNALLGDYDLAFVIKFKSSAQALEASLTLSKVTGISFNTWPAVSVSEFDEMAKRA
jgi:uncharacterized protein with GYD domain